MSNVTPTVERYFSGYQVSGAEIAIALTASDDGRISVSVIALPAATGFTAGADLSHNLRHYFLEHEVVIYETRLECFAAVSPRVPYYREGFSVLLEPGMADALQPLVPKVAQVAQLAQFVTDTVTNILPLETGPQRRPHRRYAVTDAVARVLLDMLDLEGALDIALIHASGDESVFREAMLSADVREQIAFARAYPARAIGGNRS